MPTEGAGVSWSDDVAPWFDGHVAVAVTDLPASAMEMPTDPMAVPEVPPTVFLLGVTDAAAAEAGIGRLIAAAEAQDTSLTFTDTEHDGVTIRSVEGSEGGAYALTEDQLVIGSDADVVATALDTHAAGTGTLAEMAEITRLTDTLPTDWLMFMTYDMTDLMAEAFAQGASASPEIAAALESLMANQPLRGAMAVSAAGDRFLLDSATEPPTGPFAPENADRGLAGEVPADTLYYSEAGNLGAALAAVIEPMKQALSTTPEGEEQIRTAEGAIGADLEELVSWVDDGAIAIGYDGSQPYGGMVLVPNDVAAAERRLGQLATFAGLGALDPSSGITVDEEEVDGVTVTTITLGLAGRRGHDDAADADRRRARVRRDRRPGDHRHRRRLRAARPCPRCGRFPGVAAALLPRRSTSSSGRENAGVVWLDLAGTREAIESALGPMLAEGDLDGMYETEIRPWLLPLDRIVSVTRLEGDVLRPTGRAAGRMIPLAAPAVPRRARRRRGSGRGARAPRGCRRSAARLEQRSRRPLRGARARDHEAADLRRGIDHLPGGGR